MSHRLVVLPSALKDLLAAYDWYEQERKGLGDGFLLAVSDAVQSLQDHPLIGPKAHREIRGVLLRRFPYTIYYQLRDDEIQVIGALHNRRGPKKLQDRMGKDP